MAIKRVTITLDEDLVDKIDFYAQKGFTSRSGYISLACTQLIQQTEIFAFMQDMTVISKKLASQTIIDPNDEETQEDFKKLEFLVNMLAQKG